MTPNQINPMKPCDLSAEEWHAIQALAKRAPDFRDQLKPGTENQVDFTLRIKGTIVVGYDTAANVTKKPDMVALLAYVGQLVDEKFGVPGIFAKIMADATAVHKSKGIDQEASDSYRDLVGSHIIQMATMIRQERRGSVRGKKMEIGQVDMAVLAPSSIKQISRATRVISFDSDD